MNQLESYDDDNKDELIKWLKSNLQSQRKNIAENKNIKENEVKNEELTLRIGHSENIKVKINFKFNFKEILEGVLRLEKKEPKYDERNNIICSYKIDFRYTTFNKHAFFYNIVFNQDFSFRNIIFKIVGYDDKAGIFDQVVDFTDVIFEKNVIVTNTYFNGYTLFESVEFKTIENKYNERIFNNVNFNEMTCCNSYMRNIVFQQCNFEELNVYKLGVDCNNFLYPTEWDTINFNECKFNKLSLGKSIIKDCRFNKSTIVEEADFCKHPLLVNINNLLDISTIIENTKFIEVYFQNGTNFYESTFTGKTYFSNIKFIENKNKDEISIKFDNIKLENNSYMTFNNINYDEEKKIFIENENSKIEIINTVINGRLDFNNVFLSKLNFEGSNIIGIFNRINLKAYPTNSDTACILKNEELKKNNTIKALKFKAIEKDLYTEELKNKKDKTPENWAEIASLKISKLSNNHGQNWFRAVGFTLGFGFLFFSLSYLFISNVNIYNIKYMFTGVFMKNYFNYLIPTNFELIKNVYENTNIFFYIFYIAGKISVGYGIVEIIQAFRKLNSKG